MYSYRSSSKVPVPSYYPRSWHSIGFCAFRTLGGTPPSEGARVVLEILGRAPNLTSLTLDNVGDFDADQLRGVLPTLVRLTYVDLRRVKIESHQDILLDATAPLATVRLSLDMSVQNYAAAPDPSPMLRAHMFSTTIETLYLQNVQLTPQSGPFPAVRRLQIKDYYLSYGRGAETLQTLFPAAREIWLFNRYLDPEFRYRLERGYGVASEMEELRKRNREWQLAHRSQLWPSLKYLRVDGEHAAYALGLTCRADRLEVLVSGTELRLLETLFEELRPRCFGFYGGGGGGGPISFYETVPRFLKPIARTRIVTHLVVWTDDGVLAGSTLEELMVELGHHLQQGAVTHLRLQIESTVWDR
ncbi:hypothetical protein K466DRAFT_564110, partial [Polyporus arcularius HHB13444]